MTPPAETVQTGLHVQGLRRYFGGVRALDGVDFEVRPGECLALIGPNGAGKSTCFACLAGQIAADGGTVHWEGRSLLGLTPAQRLARGVARTFQVAQVWGALSVLENVQLALAAARGQALPAATAAFRPLAQLRRDEALSALARVGLAAQAGVAAQHLPYGARKRLELAIALAPDPRLLLLDEPAAGLAAAERRALMQQVRALAGGGMAILYTEHNMDAVFGVADRVLVLVEGRLLAQGDAAHVAGDAQVRERYLGRSFQLPEAGALAP